MKLFIFVILTVSFNFAQADTFNMQDYISAKQAGANASEAREIAIDAQAGLLNMQDFISGRQAGLTPSQARHAAQHAYQAEVVEDDAGSEEPNIRSVH